MTRDEDDQGSGNRFEVSCPHCEARFGFVRDESVDVRYGTDSQTVGKTDVDVRCPECDYCETILDDIR